MPQNHRESDVDKGCESTAPKGKSAGFPCVFFVASPKASGGFPRAADTEEVGDCGEEHERRKAHRNRSQFCIASGKSDEEGVRHVVDYKDNLADDGRQREMRNGNRHRLLLEQFGFSAVRIHAKSPFSLVNNELSRLSTGNGRKSGGEGFAVGKCQKNGQHKPKTVHKPAAVW